MLRAGYGNGSASEVALLRVNMATRLLYRPATERDAEPIRSLLESCGLPTSDLQQSHPEFTVACEGEAIVGVAGLDRFGVTGLLRSLAVSADHRGFVVGQTIVANLERRAFTTGVTEVVLLTETARPFFESRGYQVIERASAPAPIHASTEFRTLCPQSACCMAKKL